MRRGYWLALALPFALLACGGEEADTEDVSVELPQTDVGAPSAMGTDTTQMQQGGTGMEVAVDMSAVGNSGVTGQASITSGTAGASTPVRVTLNGMQPNSAHPGHIHQGTCQSPGQVVAPLQEIRADASGSGSMTASVEVAANTVMDGQHIIAYHGQDGATMVCGQIPQHQM